MDNIIPFYQPTAKKLVRGRGCYVFDSDGKEYIDFESGVWCTGLGHCHPEINALAREQMERLSHHGYSFRNEQAEGLSEMLLEKTCQVGGQSVFLSSGSEAVDLSIRIAREITGKKKIIKIKTSYLSAYGFGSQKDDDQNSFSLEIDDIEAIEKINWRDAACFILETGGASLEMVRFPSIEFVEKVDIRIREGGGLLIVDEVTTGIGRTGKWFGFQHYDLCPDIVAMGKGLGNGYPISAVTISRDTAIKLSENHFCYAQSHQNDPLGCAIAAGVIRNIEDEHLLAKVRKASERLKETLCDLKMKYPSMIKEIKIRGLMIGVELFSKFDQDYVSSFLFNNGVLASFKLDTVRLLPPLVVAEKEINHFATVLEKLFRLEGRDKVEGDTLASDSLWIK